MLRPLGARAGQLAAVLRVPEPDIAGGIPVGHDGWQPSVGFQVRPV
jgi:hypothetical protein